MACEILVKVLLNFIWLVGWLYLIAIFALTTKLFDIMAEITNLRKAIKEMAVGSSLEVPLERYEYVQSVKGRLMRLKHKPQYVSSSDKETETITILRTA